MISVLERKCKHGSKMRAKNCGSIPALSYASIDWKKNVEQQSRTPAAEISYVRSACRFISS